MGTGAIITLVATLSTALGYALQKLVDHILGRGKFKEDVATQIRAELREDNKLKDEKIKALEQRIESKDKEFDERIAALEQELNKVERERDALSFHFNRYRLDIYRLLVDRGADKDLINSVLELG